MSTADQDYYVLDHAVARHIMGLPDSVLQDPHFPLPHYSTDRNAANQVLDKLLFIGGDVLARFDAALLAMEGGWPRTAKPHRLLFGITPDMICRAGLAAVRPDHAEPGSA